jgi:hypothetical protein
MPQFLFRCVTLLMLVFGCDLSSLGRGDYRGTPSGWLTNLCIQCDADLMGEIPHFVRGDTLYGLESFEPKPPRSLLDVGRFF